MLQLEIGRRSRAESTSMREPKAWRREGQQWPACILTPRKVMGLGTRSVKKTRESALGSTSQNFVGCSGARTIATDCTDLCNRDSAAETLKRSVDPCRGMLCFPSSHCQNPDTARPEILVKLPCFLPKMLNSSHKSADPKIHGNSTASLALACCVPDVGSPWLGMHVLTS